MNFHRQPHTYVGQVNLKVANLDRALTFYQEVIGFQILQQSENRVELTANGKNPLLTIEKPENITPKQRNTTGLYHFALLLPNRSDLGRFLQHLYKLNYPFGASDHYVSEAIYLSDPEGNGIEIYVDRPSSTWDWKNGEVEMATAPLERQHVLAAGKGVPWNRLPSATLLGHIHLQVSELQMVEEFYCKGLGFDVVNRYGSQALFISSGGYHHHIGLNTWAGVGAPPPTENSAGLHWFELILPNEESINKVVKQLREIGALVSQENDVYIAKDPSGNEVHLQL